MISRLWLHTKMWWLKRKMRSAYRAMLEYEDEYDCGVRLLREVNPTYARLDDACTAMVKQYRELEAQLAPPAWTPYTCPKCGAEISKKSDYCPSCNAPLWDWDDQDD